ncbi:uncharacterized protein LOC133359534 isoform X1 [Lethenteron reissneri]|uniref:uncharacterized protein LOC133359534 isoform X1 n=1 Tax=Lethenteron reissneri TaxID=7753 RepID=UPI002AB6BA8C|nr:uncharacterized protein LOC133359534 isoform X1 [Lethenteron reissneri]
MSSFVEIRTEDAHRIIIIIMIRRRGRRGSWWLVLVVVSERGKMLMAVLALCCCAGLVAATPTEDPCPLGFYHVEELCCELCKPGQFVLFECMKNNGPSTCLECPNGYYTAMANHLSGCLKCTPCDEDEDVDQPCTGSSDTLCRCKAGFQRADDGLCSSTGGGKTAGIVVSVVLLLMLVAAAAAAFIYKMKGGRFPCDSIEVKLIKDNRAEIIRLVCDDPGSLLDEVESLGYKNVYSRVIAQKKECQGERLIDEMISLGQKACQDLIRALEAVQDKYEGLQQLLDMILTPTSGRRQDDYGSAGRLLDRKPSASEYDADERESQTTTQPDGPDGNQRGAADPNGHRLNYNEYVEGEPGNSNQQELAALGLLNAKAPIPETGPCAVVRDMDELKAAKLIKRKRPELKKWIGRDPTYLLDYLNRMDLISRDIYHGARDITVKVERANFLIDQFIDRDECLKLWRALESLQDHYPQLEEWISACASTMPHTCVRDMDESKAAKLIKGKRPELKTWIGRDPTYLLDYLDSRDLISRDIYKRARDITVKEERANFLIDEFIDRDEFLKLWRALESLQDHYPQLKEWISACVLTTHHAFEKAPGRDANVHYSTTPAGEVAANEEAFRRLTACSDEQLLDGIKKNMMALVEAIEGDVRPVLTKLFEKEIFTIAEMNAVSTTQTNKSGSEAASQLITMLLHKGDRVAREFWMALWNLKTNYPRMPKIFENVLLIIEPAV